MDASKIQNVKIADIDANPMRRLAEYPYNPDKIAALRQSIHDVGLWAGVIGRKAGNRIQIAFGHHRIEAARLELGRNKEVPVIIRNLSDKEMLEFMGRENLEDYNANFTVMLESWEAARDFLGEDPRQKPKAIEIARLLGWVTPRTTRDGIQMKEVAMACDNALTLIEGGQLAKQKLQGLAVNTVREICQNLVSRLQTLEAMAAKSNRPKKELEQAKRTYVRASEKVADDARQGKIAKRDIRSRIDIQAARDARAEKQQTPLFAAFAERVVKSIQTMLRDDNTAERLNEIAEALPQITTEEDRSAVRHIDFALAEHGHVTEAWRKRLASKGKVVPLHLLKKDAS